MDMKNGTLELFAQVVLAKNVQKDEPIFFRLEGINGGVVVLPRQVCLENIDGEPITSIQNVSFEFDRNDPNSVIVTFNSNVVVTINFDLVFVVKTATNKYSAQVVPGTFTKTICLDDFCPSLTPAELAEEVEDAEVLVRNVRFDVNLRRGETCTINGKTGTPADVLVFADIITKLTAFKDIVVVGELDVLEKEC